MQNCLSILGFLDAVYSVLQKSIPYRVLLYEIRLQKELRRMVHKCKIHKAHSKSINFEQYDDLS
ncbi:MAG: hypothetical protein ACRY3E_00455 [Candidatus Lariskella arthropodorum]